MKLLAGLILAVQLFLSQTQAAPSQPAKFLLLVPGFFNSFASEYFSQNIVQAFGAKGFNVVVVNSLNPVGSFEENGERLYQVMARIENNENGRVEFDLVGHSAGGMYSLFVANKRKFNIKHIYTVATPLKGIEFLDEWMKNSLAFNALTALVRLDSLKQFTPDNVARFLAAIRVPAKTKVMAFGGFQPIGPDVFDARTISVPLRITGQFISGKSDGVVGFDSALGVGTVKNTDGKSALLNTPGNAVLALEHWEQVLDARSFSVLGIRNLDFIRQEQSRFYGGLADLLKR